MSSLNLSPFANPPGTAIPGDAIPVTLLGSAMWGPLTKAANAKPADLSLSDGKMNPLDMFHSFHAITNPAVPGIAVMIVNGRNAPLRLVDSFAYEQQGNADDRNGPQLGYPAIIDPDTQAIYKSHEIPGMKSYPRPSLHGNGDPSKPESGLMAVGLYRFQTSFLNYPLQVNRGLAFSSTEDGSGPLLGVAFTYNKGYFTDPDLTAAVTVDVSTQGKADTPSNLQALIEGPDKDWESNNALQIFGRYASQTPVYEPAWCTLVVYVS